MQRIFGALIGIFLNVLYGYPLTEGFSDPMYLDALVPKVWFHYVHVIGYILVYCVDLYNVYTTEKKPNMFPFVVDVDKWMDS